MKTLMRQMAKNGESGQSIIVLAIAFFALAAFVGIVTDVSLLFVRYSTLRRAVDAASVAAATQYRQGTSFATISLAARQFIEFYGLDPEIVMVNTCEQYQNPADDPELCVENGGNSRKQVRVIAQISSPTVFLKLIGWEDVTLQASAISETAALDVVVILDVSESMLNETTYRDWAIIGQGRAYVPPRVAEEATKIFTQTGGLIDYPISPDYTATNIVEFWKPGMLAVPQSQINGLLKYPGDAGYDTSKPFNVREFIPTSVSSDPVLSGIPQGQPRPDCRVKFFPSSVRMSVPNDATNPLKANYAAQPGGWATAPAEYPQNANLWDGFVPTYNYFDCCNDPTNGGRFNDDGTYTPGAAGKDWDFSDMICQPLKQARDATLQFVERLDFPQDRVAFVTYDRSAFIIDPYSKPADLNSKGQYDHMINRLDHAKETIKRYIGVRSEPYFYEFRVDRNDANASNKDDAFGNSGWVGYSSGRSNDTDGDGVDDCVQAINPGCSVAIDYTSSTTTTADLDSNAVWYNYPVANNCYFLNAALPAFFSNYTYGPPAVLARYADPVLQQIQIPDPYSAEFSPLNISSAQSYELWAACRNSNSGGALREANRALIDNLNPRTANSVWVIVMLSDGAAGGSDPVRRGGLTITASNPYSNPGGYNGSTAYFGTKAPNAYGSFGLCPVGTNGVGATGQSVSGSPTDGALRSSVACKDGSGSCGTLGEVVDEYGTGNTALFPFCSDEEPSTRHRCNFDGDRTVGGLNWDVDLTDFGGCDPLYDVDDYARDWADHIGLVKDTEQGEVIKPTIFTIGFGINFETMPVGVPAGTDPADVDWRAICDANVADCLGEELLRYIADAGDNFRMDNDYWQDWLEAPDPNTREFDGLLTDADGDFGVRGPCQDQTVAPIIFGLGTNEKRYDDFELMYAAAPATTNCGNYFNAPSPEELELVFDEIASRMFTRLSR